MQEFVRLWRRGILVSLHAGVEMSCLFRLGVGQIQGRHTIFIRCAMGPRSGRGGIIAKLRSREVVDWDSHRGDKCQSDFFPVGVSYKSSLGSTRGSLVVPMTEIVGS